MSPEDEQRLRNGTLRKRHMRRMTHKMPKQQPSEHLLLTEHAMDWHWLDDVSSGNDSALTRPFTYQNWNHMEPNNGKGGEHCMQMLWIFNWAWNDADCHAEKACFVCQKDPARLP